MLTSLRNIGKHLGCIRLQFKSWLTGLKTANAHARLVEQRLALHVMRLLHRLALLEVIEETLWLCEPEVVVKVFSDYFHVQVRVRVLFFHARLVEQRGAAILNLPQCKIRVLNSREQLDEACPCYHFSIVTIEYFGAILYFVFV